MRLEKFKDKNKIRRKRLIISITLVLLISASFILYKTFASFKKEIGFRVMSWQVDYYGNADLIFVFYKNDQEIDEMPKKDNEENLVYDHYVCSDEAVVIEWDEEAWAPLVKNLSKSKVKSSLYFVDRQLTNNGTLRKIDTYNDTNGMWNYKDKLTKIVIEDKKHEVNGNYVYSPFDESEDKDFEVQSYVVCEEENKNCIGYLQGDGGIKLNKDSSYLFSGFENVSDIEGIN